MSETADEITRKFYHGLSDEQWEECKDHFPYSSIPHIAKEHTQQRLATLREKLNKQTLMNIVAGCIKTTKQAHGEIKTTSLAKRIGSQINAIIEKEL